MAKNKTAGARRIGAVKARSQVKNPLTGTWTKRDDKSGKFMDVKADPRPFRGIRREPTSKIGLVNPVAVKSGHITRITRFEVIDERAKRAFVREGCSIEFSVQDEGRTLKVFVYKVAGVLDVTRNSRWPRRASAAASPAVPRQTPARRAGSQARSRGDA
jgi:hypothetical protein